MKTGKAEVWRKLMGKNREAVVINKKSKNEKTKLKCFYTNARSIINKRNE